MDGIINDRPDEETCVDNVESVVMLLRNARGIGSVEDGEGHIRREAGGRRKLSIGYVEAVKRGICRVGWRSSFLLQPETVAATYVCNR